VPDTAHDIQSAVREALSRADLIITTGGLGPTSDDLTRDLMAQLLGKKLRLDEAVFDHIQKRFAARNLPMPKDNEVQALVPKVRWCWPIRTAPRRGWRWKSNLRRGEFHEPQIQFKLGARRARPSENNGHPAARPAA